jgi:hypothetical protein
MGYIGCPILQVPQKAIVRRWQIFTFFDTYPLRWQFFLLLSVGKFGFLPLKNADVINGWSHILHIFVTPHLVDMKIVVKF